MSGRYAWTTRRATHIDHDRRELTVTTPDGTTETLGYDALIVGTGAVPVRPPIAGLTGPDALGPADGVHLLHTMGETFALQDSLARGPASALIVGAGYIGLEMAEALTARGIQVTQVEQLPEVLPTVDPELGALVHAELTRHGVDVVTGAAVTRISRTTNGLSVQGSTSTGPAVWDVDLVLVVVGVRPDTTLLTDAGASTGVGGAVLVDDTMATCHWAPPLTNRDESPAPTPSAGMPDSSLGTQVVKVFDLVLGRTGLRDHEALTAAHEPVKVASNPDDHKAYYPTAHPITIRITGDTATGQLLGAQLVGSLGTEVAKRVDTYAAALHHQMTVAEISNLGLSYTPPPTPADGSWS